MSYSPRTVDVKFVSQWSFLLGSIWKNENEGFKMYETCFILKVNMFSYKFACFYTFGQNIGKDCEIFENS